MSLSTSLTAAIDEDTIEDDEALLPLVQNVSVEEEDGRRRRRDIRFLLFQFQGRLLFKIGGKVSEGEWQEAYCVYEKENIELHFKKCPLEARVTR